MSNNPTNSPTTAGEAESTVRRRSIIAGAVASGVVAGAIVVMAFAADDDPDSVAATESVTEASVDAVPAGPAPVEAGADESADNDDRDDAAPSRPAVSGAPGDVEAERAENLEEGNPWDIDLEFEDGTPVEAVDVPSGLRELCINTRHGESESGIWVRGEVYGLSEGYIFVSGPTINDGQEVEIPVTEGAFDAPLVIRQFGDHELEAFSLSEGVADTRLDLLPTLRGGPGDTVPVGPDDGPNFDTECFEFDLAESGSDAPLVVEEPPVPNDSAIDDVAVDPDQIVREFLDSLVTLHRNGDAAGLVESLHPSARVSFGEQTCSDYVERTTGSIADATLLGAAPPQELSMRTPDGVIVFPEAIPFTVEFELVDGSTVVNDAHLPINGQHAHWLTMCGVDVP